MKLNCVHTAVSVLESEESSNLITLTFFILLVNFANNIN